MIVHYRTTVAGRHVAHALLLSPYAFSETKDNARQNKEKFLNYKGLGICEFRRDSSIDRKKCLTLLQDFKKSLSGHISVDIMILFGSRVHGKPTRYSDFDLIVVSPSFRKKKTLQRAIGFHHYWNLDYPVDFLCYTPEEFKKLRKMSSIVQEAAEKGIKI